MPQVLCARSCQDVFAACSRQNSSMPAVSRLIRTWLLQRKETMDDPYTVVGNMKVATGIMFLQGFAQIARTGSTLGLPIFAIHGTEDKVTSPKVRPLQSMSWRALCNSFVDLCPEQDRPHTMRFHSTSKANVDKTPEYPSGSPPFNQHDSLCGCMTQTVTGCQLVHAQLLMHKLVCAFQMQLLQ